MKKFLASLMLVAFVTVSASAYPQKKGNTEEAKQADKDKDKDKDNDKDKTGKKGHKGGKKGKKSSGGETTPPPK